MRALMLILVCLTSFSLPARSADDIAEAQATIRSQEQAFIRDDAAAAYSYASPLLQNMFQLPELFMSMVQNNYAPVYRHKRFDFGDSKLVDGKVAQKVNIVDDDGVFWEALYTLERQDDGSLKIAGCVLVKTMGA